jgi:hypothetical protein
MIRKTAVRADAAHPNRAKNRPGNLRPYAPRPDAAEAAGGGSVSE